MWRKLTVVACLMLLAEPATAYIGPGIGAGMIATVLGILTAIVLAFIALFWYPVKRLLKRSGHATKAAKKADHFREP